MNQMPKYGIQVLAFAIAIGVGLYFGSALTASKKDKEINKLLDQQKKELMVEIKQSKKLIKEREKTIRRIQEQKQQDSVLISNLYHQIQVDGVRVENERKRVSKLSTHEKVRWANDWAASQPDSN